MISKHNSFLSAVMHVLAASGNLEYPYESRAADSEESNHILAYAIIDDYSHADDIESQLGDHVSLGGSYLVYCIDQGEDAIGNIWVWTDSKGAVTRVYAQTLSGGKSLRAKP